MHISHFIVPCRDQDEARDFYVDKLGFDLVDDVPLDEDSRWLTVRAPGQAFEISLAPMNAGSSEPELARRRAETVALGGWMGGILSTDDCRRDYEKLRAKGVEFTEEPIERFYGIDSGFRDPSGVPWRLTQIAEAPGPT